ncbi:CHRD domain-containing protein [Pedobacter sp.]|uniref:CHRD domain-containing protein n=1 Tax=Pedobacter sp. TaxID=1411316 RepID=UPI0031D77D88
MRDNLHRHLLIKISVFFILVFITGCKKKEDVTEEAKVKPPLRTYIVTARIDKKGTNSNSDGTAVLKGNYDESTKILSYAVEFKNIDPTLITLRNGPKGSTGSLVKEIYKQTAGKVTTMALKGSLELSPLNERNLQKGNWFVAINTLALSPEISGILTLKQQ